MKTLRKHSFLKNRGKLTNPKGVVELEDTLYNILKHMFLSKNAIPYKDRAVQAFLSGHRLGGYSKFRHYKILKVSMKKSITMPYYWNQEDLKDVSENDIVEGTILEDVSSGKLILVTDQTSIDINKTAFRDKTRIFASMDKIYGNWNFISQSAKSISDVLALNKARLMYTVLTV